MAVRAPRAVLFDLNGTLVDERGLPTAVARTCADLVASGALPGVTADTLLAANRSAFASCWAAAEEDWTLGRVDGSVLSLEIWRQALEACGIADESIARLAVEVLKGHLRVELRLFDDVAECLQALEGPTRLGLVTNGGSDDQRERIAWLGLAGHFDAIVISAEAGVAKPDRAIYQVALEQLGVHAEDAWHVGDTLRTDVAGAQAAGVTAVWLNRGSRVPRAEAVTPDLEISSLSDLVARVTAGR